MTLINTGTTNLDGSGSASNLTVDNATSFLASEGIESVDGASLGVSQFANGFSMTYASVDVWNKTGFKEVQINTDSDLILVDNFVDVDINNNNADGAEVYVSNVKRGSIDTGAGDDTIEVSIYSNNASWSNTFSIDSGAGDDSIALYNSLNSKYTSYNIDAGSGNDVVDVSLVSEEYSSSVTRTVDGGDGFDSIVISGTDNVSFANFEAVTVTDADAVVTLTSDLLANNNADGFGLVLSSSAFSFGELSVADAALALTELQAEYIDSLGFDSADFSAFAVTDGDDTYTLFADGLVFEDVA